MHIRTCHACGRIYKTNYYFSFLCEDCAMAKINLKTRLEEKQSIGVASYSGYVGYLKYILKQSNWVELLNNYKGRQFTHSRF